MSVALIRVPQNIFARCGEVTNKDSKSRASRYRASNSRRLWRSRPQGAKKLAPRTGRCIREAMECSETKFLACPRYKNRPKVHLEVCRRCKWAGKCEAYRLFRQPYLPFPGFPKKASTSRSKSSKRAP